MTSLTTDCLFLDKGESPALSFYKTLINSPKIIGCLYVVWKPKSVYGFGLVFVFESVRHKYQTIKRSNFRQSALFCLDFLQTECHWRVNYVYASVLCIFSLRLSFLSRRMCARAGVRFVCVFANERVQALFFFWTSLWCCCLFIYFSACEGPFSAVRATVDWACVALSAIHQRGASLTDEPLTPLPIAHQLRAEMRRGIFVFKETQCNQEALCFITNLSGWVSVCVTCKTTISSLAMRYCFTLVFSVIIELSLWLYLMAHGYLCFLTNLIGSKTVCNGGVQRALSLS